MISEESLKKFAILYKDKFGIYLDRETAFSMMSKLLRLVEIVCPESAHKSQEDTKQ